MAYSSSFFAARGPAQTATASKPYTGPDLAVRLVCPDCQVLIPNIREEFGQGDLVCGDCGLILGDRIVDTRSEWRTFANDEGDDPSRVGAAADPLMEGLEQLGTGISFRDGGTGMARDLQRTMAKGAVARAEKGLMSGFREINNMCEQISLPKAHSDIAKHIFRLADQEKLLKGKSTTAIVACCVFMACRQGGVPRTFKEICQLAHVPKKQIGQCYKIMQSHLNINEKIGTVQLEGPEKLLGRYVNHLDLPMSIERAAVDLVIACREHGVADGRSPISIAGAAIYFASHLFGHPKSGKEIAGVAGVSESTIKLVYRLIYQHREKLIPKEAFEVARNPRADWTRLPSVAEK